VRHFNRTLLAGLCIVLATACCLAQEASKTDVPKADAAKPDAPSTFIPEHNDTLNTGGPRTMRLDPCTLFPPGGPPYSLFSPFEFYARPNAAISTGSGPLSSVLRTGVGADFGIRSFLYNDAHNAAWYGDLGFGYLYNSSKDASANLIVREGLTTITRFGSAVQLESITSLGLVALHRVDARLAFGREYYFESSWMEGLRYSIGGDIGGIWGQATIKTRVNDRDITGLQDGDIIAYNSADGHTSAVTKGFFFGTSWNVIIPQRTYDFSIGTRIEYQQEYFNKLVNDNDGASQIKLMLEVGWRY
jgi:hypothetical protein